MKQVLRELDIFKFRFIRKLEIVVSKEKMARKDSVFAFYTGDNLIWMIKGAFPKTTKSY